MSKAPSYLSQLDIIDLYLRTTALIIKNCPGVYYMLTLSILTNLVLFDVIVYSTTVKKYNYIKLN